MRINNGPVSFCWGVVISLFQRKGFDRRRDNANVKANLGQLNVALTCPLPEYTSIIAQTILVVELRAGFAYTNQVIGFFFVKNDMKVVEVLIHNELMSQFGMTT